MGTVDTVGIKLGAKLGHPVFVPDRVGCDSKIPGKKFIQFVLMHIASTSLKAARFHNDASRRHFHLQIRRLLEKIQKRQRRTEQRQRSFTANKTFPEPVEFKTSILRDKKALAPEVGQDSSHSAKRRERRVVGVLHQ